MDSDYLFMFILWGILAFLFYFLIKRFRTKKEVKIHPNQFEGEININLKGEIDFKKYRNYFMVKSYLRPTYIIVSIIFLIMIIGLVYKTLFTGEDNAIELIPLIFFALYISLPIFTFVRIKKIYKESDTLRRQTEYRISNEGIRIIGKSIDSKLNWEHYIDFKETKYFYIFYSSKFTATILQKDWFTEEELAEFKEFLNSTSV